MKAQAAELLETVARFNLGTDTVAAPAHAAEAPRAGRALVAVVPAFA